MKFRTKPEIIEAVQWFKNGDHPLDESQALNEAAPEAKSEGKVVRSYRRPVDMPELLPCKACKLAIKDHGWVDIRETGRLVCPGDWIITLPTGEKVPCKPELFAKKFESVKE